MTENTQAILSSFFERAKHHCRRKSQRPIGRAIKDVASLSSVTTERVRAIVIEEKLMTKDGSLLFDPLTGQKRESSQMHARAPAAVWELPQNAKAIFDYKVAPDLRLNDKSGYERIEVDAEQAKKNNLIAPSIPQAIALFNIARWIFTESKGKPFAEDFISLNRKSFLGNFKDGFGAMRLHLIHLGVLVADAPPENSKLTREFCDALNDRDRFIPLMEAAHQYPLYLKKRDEGRYESWNDEPPRPQTDNKDKSRSAATTLLRKSSLR